MARAFNPGGKRYRRAPKGDFNETITLPWGEQCNRILSVPEFCTKFGVHRNTVRWHRGKGRLDCFKVKYRWYIDMKTSQMPNGYAPGSPDTHQLNLKGQRRELSHVGRRHLYYIEFDGESHGFSGYGDIYDTFGEILGVKDGRGYCGGFSKTVWNGLQLRLQLTNGKRVFCLCNPENLVGAMEQLRGKSLRGSVIEGCWVPRRIKYV